MSGVSYRIFLIFGWVGVGFSTSSLAISQSVSPFVETWGWDFLLLLG